MVHSLDHIAAQRRAAQATIQSTADLWLESVLAAMGGGTTTEQSPVVMGGPEPPDFSRLEAEQLLRDFMAEHGGGGGGFDPFGYFTSGAEYWAAQGAEAAEYISNIPGEAGEAGGEFLAGVGAGAGAGIGSLVDPLTAIPGDLFKNIPIWVPVLGAAFLLTR